MLNITADLVRELAEHHGRADETGIILTCDGWEVTTWAGRRQDSALVAMTKEGVYAWTDGDELDEDDAEALATSEDYRIPNEHGNPDATPAEDARPQVVTATWTGRLLPAQDASQGEAETSWQGAWWFDQSKAVQLISERAGQYRETGTASSLWRTEGGRYVMHTRTVRGGYSETWTELDHAQVAEWAYSAGDDEICEVEQPPVIVAARAASTITDALVPPRVPWFDGGVEGRFHRADRVMDEAAEIVHTAAVISDLLRLTVAPQLRAHRSRAARVVELAHDGNQTAAAEWLGMGRSTFAKLLPSA